MKPFTMTLFAMVMLAACQQSPRQYFTSSPEIDLVRKGNAAYLAGDWETFRSCYGDTARIWDNSWDPTKGITPDQYIESMKASLANLSSYSIGDDAIYEMVVTDNGQHWVRNWFEWKGVTKTGMEVTAPVNVSFLVENGKVQWQVDIYNALPLYLASQTDTTTNK
jgi:hypothetical protein